jgi:hypothetical protein
VEESPGGDVSKKKASKILSDGIKGGTIPRRWDERRIFVYFFLKPGKTNSPCG